jgi:protein-L-isoaspartate(D-aspartate) O-methyltransferase
MIFNKRPSMDPKQRMIELHLRGRDIKDTRVLDAFEKVPREAFVGQSDQPRAYSDHPLSIGYNQTISQPYIVGLTVQTLNLQETDTVLELGTGSGYEAAILSLLCSKVITVERIPELADKARSVLESLGYTNIEVIIADGTLGYAENAPYNAIAVSAAAPSIPDPLIEQLDINGRMVIPVGPKGFQELTYVKKDGKGNVVDKRNVCNCTFVPLIGEKGF